MKLLYPFPRSTLAQACRILNLLFVLGCGGCMTHEAMQIGRRTTVIHSPESLAESEADDLILRCEVTVRDPENDVRERLGNRYVVVPHTVANKILLGKSPYEVGCRFQGGQDGRQFYVPMNTLLSQASEVRVLENDDDLEAWCQETGCGKLAWRNANRENFSPPTFTFERTSKPRVFRFGPSSLDKSTRGWSIPVKIVMVPPALALDLATAPFQWVYYSTLQSFHDSFTWGAGEKLYNPWTDGP
jgi:hypothetical protein